MAFCNHVCFTDVAAPSDCWRLFEEKNSLDLQLREGVERSITLFQPIFEGKVRENWPTLSK
jgi:hypothetical protein